MDKYYMPEKSEFFEGFEYQIRDIGKPIDNYAELHWGDTQTFSLEHFSIFKYEIRVKYLDKQDIEALGWAHSFNDDGEESPSLQDKHGYSLGFSIDKQDTPLNTAYLLHYFPDQYLIIDSIVNNGSGRDQMLFRGYIKNKNELKKLMQQLMITP